MLSLYPVTKDTIASAMLAFKFVKSNMGPDRDFFTGTTTYENRPKQHSSMADFQRNKKSKNLTFVGSFHHVN